MDKKFAGKGQYRFCYIVSIILLIFSLICTIPAPFFLVFDIVFGFAVYSFRNTLKNYDIEKSKHEKNQNDSIKEKKSDNIVSSAPIATCPKCGSTSLSVQGKRLSIKRAIAGTVLLNPLGGAVGAVTSKKNYCVCMNCGHKCKL